MFRNLTLGKRIGLGIFIMLVLMVAVGAGGYMGLTQTVKATDFYQQINKLQVMGGAINDSTNQYLLLLFGGDKETIAKTEKQTFGYIDKALKEIGTIKSISGTDGESHKKLDTADKSVKSYKGLFGQYIEAQNTKLASNDEINRIYEEIIIATENGKLFWGEAIDTARKIFISDFVRYSYVATEENWTSVESSFGVLKKSIDDYLEKVTSSDELRPAGEKLTALCIELQKPFNDFHSTILTQTELAAKMSTSIKGLLKICDDLGKASLVKLQEQSKISQYFILGLILIALIIGVIYAFFSIRSIVGKIKTAISGVDDGAEKVADASDQVSTASQSLAEGSSEQAASIEETSSSLEEMSSMTKQNAENANEAKHMMTEASQVVDKVNGHMNDMTLAIEEISKSSQETSKIVQNIDDIAFQTNLLALNAAVEAARAGEAGAGFAVVADEVRNLALRAAESARNTAEMIENTLKTVKNGNDLTKLTKDAFSENMDISKKVADLVEEIAVASNEQAEGIDQVNMAVAEMDKVVQQNAASAEESASAAEEMNGSANHLKAIVKEMNILVGRSNSTAENEPVNKQQAQPVAQGVPKTFDNKMNMSSKKEIGPGQVLDMPQDDFEDF